MAEDSPKKPRPGRPHTLAPAPPFLDWTQNVDGLEEAGGDLAIAFWRILRRVRDWAEAAPEERAELFRIDMEAAHERLGAACAHAPGLVRAFGTFALMIEAPGEVEARRVAEACSKVYQWADDRSLLRVATLFAEAAAYVEPENPTRAIDAGWMCRRTARHDRSERWYDRALGLAIRAKDQLEAIRAQTEYGALMKDLGHYDKARKHYRRAAQRAMNEKYWRRVAVAHHYLLVMAAEVGTYREGEWHARRALDLYPIHDERIPYLAHDYALLLLQQHHFSLALGLLERLRAAVVKPEERLLVLGSIARATAGTRCRVRFEEVEQAILPLVERHYEFAPAALLYLAEGARAFGEWERATNYAECALKTAQSRKDYYVERHTLELRSKLDEREAAPFDEEPQDRERIDRIIRRLKARLGQWKAPSTTKLEAEPGDSSLSA